jgi:tRNA (guanine10-N2)-dimethyltransferase
MKESLNEILTPKSDTYLFELSGEHESLPGAEITASLKAEGFKFEITEEDFGILIVKSPDMKFKKMQNRLALSHNIDSQICSSDINKIEKLGKRISIKEGSFAVRGKRVQTFNEAINLKELEKKVADCVLGENAVNLKDPANEIRVIISQRGHIGLALAKIPRKTFEEREVKRRPYFSPVSLHPRLARALVNLSQVKPKERLHDPFCGTGGICMEAALVGAKTTGSDIDSKMVLGCQKNLDSFNISNVEIFQTDVGEIPGVVKSVDAIATDPPYGKSATTNREDIKSLYERAFSSFSKILKDEGHVAIVLPDKELIEIGKRFFTLNESHPFRVHRSLTRNFCVFQKI